MNTVARAVLFASLIAPSGALASTFGQASNFNVFVLGNDTQTGAEIQGRLAVGGNWTGSTRIGTNLSSNSGYDLVVGGNLNFTNNSITGDVFVAGDGSFAGASLSHDVHVNGNLNYGGMGAPGGISYYGLTYSGSGSAYIPAQKGTTTSPVNFATAQTNLQSLSSFLNTEAPTTANTSVVTNATNITINAGHGLNVVNFTAAQLSANTGITVNGFSDSTLLINVDGTATNATDSFAAAGITLGSGITGNQILFNFAKTTALSSNGAGIYGSILAPFAAFNFASGKDNGQIFANTLSGAGVSASGFDFTGTLPAVTATPEPGTLASLSGGFLLLAGFAFKNSRKR